MLKSEPRSSGHLGPKFSFSALKNSTLGGKQQLNSGQVNSADPVDFRGCRGRTKNPPNDKSAEFILTLGENEFAR